MAKAIIGSGTKKAIINGTNNNFVVHPDLVGYWKFDEGSGNIAHDSSVFGNNGTLINGPTWTTGQVNNALSFDGVNDYVDCGKGAGNLLTTGSIEVWVYTDRNYPSDTSSYYYRGIIAKTTGGAAGQQSWWIDWYGTNSIRYLRAGIGDASSSIIILANYNFNHQWHHLVFTFDGSLLKLYDDGNLLVSSAQTKNPQFLDVSLQIGRAFGVSYWQGLIDEPRIYNRALSAEEIKRHYDLTK